MTVPSGLLELTVSAVVGFIFKVVFGLIAKNERKSEDEDRRLEIEIKDLRKEMKEIEERYRSNDRDLYKTAGDVKEAIAYMRGKDDAKN